MDLDRMLERCQKGQWRLDDIDWSRPPRALEPRVEREVVQYFTDMAQIERLAGALFAEQRRRATDPVLREIFTTFVVDEERHARAAEKLAAHFDTRKLASYAPSPSLVAFRPKFLGALRYVSAEVANAYIVGGELLLDIALLRSIDDFLKDETCHDVMALINRDESRHVAIDYFMVDYYASPAWAREVAKAPRKSPAEIARATYAFVGMLLTAKPFIRDVFVLPMTRVDPERRRMREAFKRMQLLSAKPGVAARPFSRFLHTMKLLYASPLTHGTVGRVAERLVGVPGEYLRDLYTKEEFARAERLSMDQLADEALESKYTPVA
ncbi:MAG: ferritin-like domain-containing protein [Myxococcales bacterium]|nr:ferritin-like domain-containing protein [Myxococcales bacterium]